MQRVALMHSESNAHYKPCATPAGVDDESVAFGSGGIASAQPPAMRCDPFWIIGITRCV